MMSKYRNWTVTSLLEHKNEKVSHNDKVKNPHKAVLNTQKDIVTFSPTLQIHRSKPGGHLRFLHSFSCTSTTMANLVNSHL